MNICVQVFEHVFPVLLGIQLAVELLIICDSVFNLLRNCSAVFYKKSIIFFNCSDYPQPPYQGCVGIQLFSKEKVILI